jgi:hypothetical protein
MTLRSRRHFSVVLLSAIFVVTCSLTEYEFCLQQSKKGIENSQIPDLQPTHVFGHEQSRL